jgi:hypothetical protein
MLMGPAIGPHSPQLAVPKRQCNKTKRRMSALISNILRLDSQRGVSPKLNCRSHNNKIRKKRKTFWPTNANVIHQNGFCSQNIYSYLGELIIASPKEVKEREL